MTVLLSVWESYIRPFCPGISSGAINQAVRDSAIEFCRETDTWVEKLGRIDVIADTYEYILSVNDAKIVSIENAKYKQDGEDDTFFRNLEPLSERQKDRQQEENGNWKFLKSSGPDGYYYDLNHEAFYLSPIPTIQSIQGLLIKVICIPSNDALTISSFLYDNYKLVIQAGAMYILYNQLAMPWANPSAAAQALIRFEEGKAEAKRRVRSGATSMPITISFQGDDWL